MLLGVKAANVAHYIVAINHLCSRNLVVRQALSLRRDFAICSGMSKQPSFEAHI